MRLSAAGFGQGRGRGAGEAARRRRDAPLPQIWFDRATTEGGRDALGWYHEKQDKVRGIGLGPAHDWASHASDAFGLMCVAYEAPRAKVRKVRRREAFFGAGGWMG